MWLPEAKIKGAIVHPEKLVRQEALRYFAGCYSRDARGHAGVCRLTQVFGVAEVGRMPLTRGVSGDLHGHTLEFDAFLSVAGIVV